MTGAGQDAYMPNDSGQCSTAVSFAAYDAVCILSLDGLSVLCTCRYTAEAHP